MTKVSASHHKDICAASRLFPIKNIAKAYGVHIQTIYRILARSLSSEKGNVFKNRSRAARIKRLRAACPAAPRARLPYADRKDTKLVLRPTPPWVPPRTVPGITLDRLMARR